MSAEHPISQTLADAFGRMVYGYALGDWIPEKPELVRLSIDYKSYDYESFCRWIEEEKFDDPLPEVLVTTLLGQIQHPDSDLKHELAKSPSYSDAAKALRHVMEKRKDDYRKRT